MTASAGSPSPSTFDDNNRQTKANNVALSYDGNGNLISDGSLTYVWDDRDRLIQIKSGSTIIASFSYDALGRRIAKTESGITTNYLYDGLDAVQETQGTTVNPILTGAGIDQRYARNEASGRTYFLTDLLGSTRLLTDMSGAAIQRYDYDPYGTTIQSSAGVTNPYQYTGREKDKSGLYYYRVRYYQPGWGRFVSEDPLRLAAGPNSYTYVGGSPTSRIDPLGLDFFGKCLAQSYMDKYGKDAWWKAVADRSKFTGEIFPGTPAEALRNAEHYLYSYMTVNENSYGWGPALVNTVGYHTVKFWGNVADSYGAVNCPYKDSWPTHDELKAGLEGANDSLFGDNKNSTCGCGQ